MQFQRIMTTASYIKMSMSDIKVRSNYLSFKTVLMYGAKKRIYSIHQHLFNACCTQIL